MSAAPVLEQFLNTLKGLPNDLQRSFATIQSIQSKINVAQARLEELQGQMLTIANKPGPVQQPESIQVLSELRQMQHLVYSLHAEQVALATQARDIIYSYCRRADLDVKKLEAELPPEALSIESTPKRSGDRNHKGMTGSHRMTAPGGIQDSFGEFASIAEPAAVEAAAGTATGSEDLFCRCRKPSYGEMVGCDGPNCEFEWFHFQCVDLKRKPKGTWFCSSQCQKDYQRANPSALA